MNGPDERHMQQQTCPPRLPIPFPGRFPAWHHCRQLAAQRQQQRICSSAPPLTDPQVWCTACHSVLRR